MSNELYDGHRDAQMDPNSIMAPVAAGERDIVLVVSRDEADTLWNAAQARARHLVSYGNDFEVGDAARVASRAEAAYIRTVADRLRDLALAHEGDHEPKPVPLPGLVAMADTLHGELVRKQRGAVYEDDEGGHKQALLDNTVNAARGVRGYLSTQWWVTESPAAMQSPGAALYVQVKAIADDEGVTKDVAKMAQLILDKPEQLEEDDAQARVESLLLGIIRRKCDASKPVNRSAAMATPTKTAYWRGFNEAVDLVASGEHEAEGYTLREFFYDQMKHAPDDAYTRDYSKGFEAGVKQVTA